MIKELIAQLIDKKDLTEKEAYQAMKEIMEGAATPSQIAGFLVALRMKGERAAEIAGCALAMRDAARPLTLKADKILDSCGTGGDGKGGLNISTAVAFVVAGAGWTVAKHGNRAISSKCGSADVLEALGVRMDSVPAAVEQSLNEAGVGFMFAPSFHPAMKNAMPTRKELGFRTVFNLLGPLTNPAKARVQLIGVYDPSLTKILAEVLKKMGHLGGLVVNSGGWDEITLDGRTTVTELVRGKIKSYTLTHRDFGLPKVSSKHLAGGSSEDNARMIREILEGKKSPVRDVIVANAAALLWVADRAYNNAKWSLKDAVAVAESSLDSGAALKKLEDMIRFTQAFEP